MIALSLYAGTMTKIDSPKSFLPSKQRSLMAPFNCRRVSLPYEKLILRDKAATPRFSEHAHYTRCQHGYLIPCGRAFSAPESPLERIVNVPFQSPQSATI